MLNWISALEERLLSGEEATGEEGLRLFELEGADVYELFSSANRIARANKGRAVELCSIVNAKSGRCPENCAFCTQSAHHRTASPVYPLKSPAELTAAAQEAEGFSTNRFGIITSGTGVKEGPELDAICEAVSSISRRGKLAPCASLGIMSENTLKKLKASGLTRFHHNLETARSFFPKICTTHDYEDDVATVRAARNAGLSVCSGGIFGLGESRAQRVEMALTLRDLGVDSVPVNFLVPVKGTRMEGMPPLAPLEALKIIAVFRFLLPGATIRVCAGRDRNLRDLYSWIFFAGADGMMIGNFLTTVGRDVKADLEMISQLGFTPVAEGGKR
ncbi:biotin synthase BioB [bacterium]|nr:MAG: biotin synthase BioB [bacterium]